MYLERAVVSLQLPAKTLQFAASQDGLAVLVSQVILFLDQLVLFLLQHSHLFLGVTVLFQLSQTHTHTFLCEGHFKDKLSYIKVNVVDEI